VHQKRVDRAVARHPHLGVVLSSDALAVPTEELIRSPIRAAVRRCAEHDAVLTELPTTGFLPAVPGRHLIDVRAGRIGGDRWLPIVRARVPYGLGSEGCAPCWSD